MAAAVAVASGMVGAAVVVVTVAAVVAVVVVVADCSLSGLWTGNKCHMKYHVKCQRPAGVPSMLHIMR